MMWAARLYAPLDLRMERIPVPEPGPDDLVCRVVRAGICGTDGAIYSGEFSFVKSGDVHFPLTQGHEWSGIVARVGGNVRRFKAGDRVVSDTNVTCGKCPACLNGRIVECPELRPLGTIHAWDGAFAEYIRMPERHVFHLPDEISFDDGALVEPATIAFSAVRAARVEPGDTVLVCGTGAIGIFAAGIARIAGASRVTLLGRSAFKLDVARSAECATEYVTEFPSGPVDKVIECTGSAEVLQRGIALTRNGGTVATVAFYERRIPAFDIDRMVFGNVTLTGVANNAGTYEPVLRLFQAGMLRGGALISKRFPFREIHAAYDDLAHNKKERVKVMLEFQ